MGKQEQGINNMSEQEKRVISKVSWRLLPFLILAYLLCYVDRVNVGYAALTMNADLGFTATVYGWGAGILFFGYFLFEVPSNLALKKYGARFWIARIMISWGIISMCMALIFNVPSFLITRFLLGAAEAGFFPGILLYLTFWFPARHRATIISRFMFAQPIAMMFGSAISGWILQLHGVMGFSGWKWLFLLEGFPTVLLGLFTFKYLTDKPSEAQWLEPADRQWLQAELDAEYTKVDGGQTYSLLQTLFNPSVLLLASTYLLLAIGLMGVNLWLPQIVKAFGGLSNIQVGTIGAAPYLCTALCMLLFGRHSDKTQERKWHMTLAFLASGVCLAASSFTASNLILTMVLVTISLIGGYVAQPLFWTIPPSFLTGTGVAVGLATINSVGNLGGFFGPYLFGYVKDATGSFENGLAILGCCIVACGLLSCYVYTKIEKDQKAKMAGINFSQSTTVNVK
ncbi:MAG: transporter [Firmicutes bacterium]|nr:transporter [Bacillota bacterium]